MKTLILDLSRKDEVKILNTRIKNSVTVTSGYFLELQEGEDLVTAIAAKIQLENLTNIPVYIIPPTDMIEKNIFLFPRMPDKELKKILPREIANLRDSQDPVVFNYLLNGMAEDRQVQKTEIAAFFCRRDIIFDFIKQFNDHGIQVKQIVPEVQGLKTLVEINSRFQKKKSGVVFLDLLDNRIDMNFFKEKYWGLERGFMFRVSRSDDLKDEDFSRISTELNRTFQFFKQRNRGYNLDQVVIYGSSTNTENLKNLINDNLSVSALAITPDFFQGKITIPSHLKDSHEFISTFTLAMAVAIAMTQKKYLDLFPEEYKEKAKLPSRLIGLTVSTSIIGAILVGSTIYFQGIKANYKSDIEKIQDTYLSLGKNAATIELTKKQRTVFHQQRHYIDHPIAYSFAASDFVRKISLVSTPEIELLEMEINPGTLNFSFSLTGRIKAENNIKAQSRFLEFFQAIKQFDEVTQVDSSNVDINPGEKPGGSQSPNPNPGTTSPPEREKEVELYFTISGQAELPL